MPPAEKATTGATSAGTRTLASRPSPSTASGPPATKAAPTTPPMSACEELEGSPKYHVARFQAIAPMSPPKTIDGVIAAWSTMSPATVAATFSEMKAPAKLRIEATATAARGEAARVEIDVATTLAVSWKPLVKSKHRAVTTTMTRVTSSPMSSLPRRSAVLDDDALEQVGHALGRVDGRLEALVDVLPAHDDHRVDAALEQRGQRLAGHPVAVVLEPVDLDGVVRDVVEAPQPRHRLGYLPRALEQDVG